MWEPAQDPCAVLAPEMAALMARVVEEDGVAPDPTLLPATEGRDLTAQGNARWNVDLPAMAQILERRVPADPNLGSAECRVGILVPAESSPGLLCSCMAVASLSQPGDP